VTITITWNWLNWIVCALWAACTIQSVVAVAMGSVQGEPVMVTLARLVNAMALGAFMAGWRLVR
jgi:hypothetical protein